MSQPPQTHVSPPPTRVARIIYFDGQCTVCNRFVDFLIQRDHARVLKYASLQGGTAAKNLSPAYRQDLSTVVLDDQGELLTESSAIIRAVGLLGGVYRLIGLLLLIPKPLRNRGYRLFAKHRHKILAPREACRLPTPEERGYFLD